jgi:hypothetical protein
MELQFVSRENVPEMPKILYKYRTWDKIEHKRLLTHTELYYASPAELDELTECKLENDYSSVTETTIWDFCLKSAMDEANKGEIYPGNILNRANYLYSINKFHDLSHRKNSEKEFKQHLNEKLSIFCSSETPINERLWNTFAGNKTGYCVGIDFTEIYKNQDLFGTCGRVHYYDENDPPKLAPLSLSSDEGTLKMMKLMYSLPDRFSKEEEFRFTKMHIPNKRVEIKPDWIKEVIIGSETTRESEMEIVELVNVKYPEATLKKLFVEPTFNYLSLLEY